MGEDVVRHSPVEGFAEQKDDFDPTWVDVHDGVPQLQADGSGVEGGEQIGAKDSEVLSRFEG